MWRREQRLRCGSCGTRADEWEQDRFAYLAQSKICPGCEILEQEKRNLADQAEGAQVYLVPRHHVQGGD